MSALTRDASASPKDLAPARPRRVRGLLWLVLNQHRTALIVCAAVVVLGAAWIVYQRAAMLDTLHAAGWPAKPVDSLGGNIANDVSNNLDAFGNLLTGLPVLLGVFLGAPLIAADQENGTARLAMTQSVSRGRWLAWKLGFALVTAVVTTQILSLFFAWWWRSAGSVARTDWLDGPHFDAMGPVPVATALFATSLGIVIGALTRRTVGSMLVTFLIVYAVTAVAEQYRSLLGTPRRLSYPLGGEEPAVLDNTVRLDDWVGTESGRVYGWSTCVKESAPEACRAQLGIVNSVRDYLGPDQLPGMQWAATGVYAALAAALVTGLLWWSRRRAL
ncbi:ABC transporter permease [Streptomyces sp. NPDC051567]|uniref:ABC transporter permease n=1 Tax=Streptomyces sp. NPDC051567 TaxID=3365660 RepID=UPI003797269A